MAWTDHIPLPPLDAEGLRIDHYWSNESGGGSLRWRMTIRLSTQSSWDWTTLGTYATHEQAGEALEEMHKRIKVARTLGAR